MTIQAFVDEYNPVNVALFFESKCGKDCNLTAVMRERFLGIDRPDDEELDDDGNEITATVGT